MLNRLHAVVPETIRRRLAWSAAALVFIWVLLFDSHSIVNRIKWHVEAARLQNENRELTIQIEELEEAIEKADHPDVVERVAREEYGMRRPGETVYRVEENGD